VHFERLSYPSALELQLRLSQDARQSNTKSWQLLTFEADPIITLGVRARADKDILRQSNLSVLKVDRGGEATYHGPGQLLIFPTLHLPSWKISVREWVALLLEVTASLLNEFEIPVQRNDSRPGLYTPKGKIASIGLKIKSGWSLHGLALNVRGDLSPFADIRACGVRGAAIDEVSSWPKARDLTLLEIAEGWEKNFKNRLYPGTNIAVR
jgi:lipoyl(octanoyl) transferase